MAGKHISVMLSLSKLMTVEGASDGPSRAAARTVRLQRLPARPATGDRGAAGGEAGAGGLSDGRRQVALLPAPGTGAGRRDARGLAAHRAHEGPDRLPPRPGHRRGAIGLLALPR